MLLFPLILDALRNKQEWLPLTSLFIQALHLIVRLSVGSGGIRLGINYLVLNETKGYVTFLIHNNQPKLGG